MRGGRGTPRGRLSNEAHVCVWHKADMAITFRDVRFSNRPVGVKRFRLSTAGSVDITRGLVLLSGIGTEAVPSWDSKTRWNNLSGGLAVGRTKRTCELTSSIVPRGTSFHHLVELELLLVRSIYHGVMLRRGCLWSSGIRCRQPRYGARLQPAAAPGRRLPFSCRGAWRPVLPKP